ncbi:MAG TPA: hypothetical protein VGN23_01795 [Verrucomicrobiae bacterium]
MFLVTIGEPGSGASKMPLKQLLATRDQTIANIDPRPARNYLHEALLALLAGRPVAVLETKPYGCPLQIYSK